ncbi:hypothetical protein MY04_0363 [Flammeovirga sp. MY04]|uniref:hypothetical protein n=1 Tax=Flammeovirga sp. MY04 TaxID=1191459 RepID=UPI0008061D1A|nr:hypothetical protein [Flammeovirga sp. MY04]ANQ47745.1 hypothetical protein MY04_0363 [Flammeovirga sp. MY04]
MKTYQFILLILCGYFSFSCNPNIDQTPKIEEIVLEVEEEYTFKELKFFKSPEDTDSLFQKKVPKLSFNGLPNDVTMPIHPIRENKRSYFRCEAKEAFLRLKDQEVSVEIPYQVEGNQIHFLEGQKAVYNRLDHIVESEHNQTKDVIVAPEGSSRFYVDTEFRKRQLSYQLILINNRTGEEKEVHGKWYEIAPTGVYKIKQEISSDEI